jgi:protein-tyrosine phosphatase
MMFVARTLLIVQLCAIAGCYRTLVDSPEQDRPGRTRVDARVDEPVQTPSDHEPVQTPSDLGPDSASWILVDDLVNARDLGGVPLGDGRSVANGVLFRGPPLAELSASGCAEFSRLGIRTVIDLRVESERGSVPEAGCIEQSARIVFAPLPVPYNVSPSDYIAALDATDSIRAAFQQLGEDESYPIYLHCTWGRDRTGILAAVILRALGASRADILQEYLLSISTVGAYPVSLEAVLDAIEQRGGIDAYLAAAGVSADQLARLRSRAVRSIEHSR